MSTFRVKKSSKRLVLKMNVSVPHERKYVLSKEILLCQYSVAILQCKMVVWARVDFTLLVTRLR